MAVMIPLAVAHVAPAGFKPTVMAVVGDRAGVQDGGVSAAVRGPGEEATGGRMPARRRGCLWAVVHPLAAGPDTAGTSAISAASLLACA